LGLRTALGLKQRRAERIACSFAASPVSYEEMQAWFGNKEFTSDWLTEKILPWFEILRPLRETAVEVLDVGSYEGRSAVAFLSYLPHSRVSCIDTFRSDEVFWSQADSSSVEEKFDRNMAPYCNRVRKIKNRAATALDQLATDGAEFDVIYLDAGKRRDWVYSLTALAWPLLRTGGILIWDDLTWGESKGRPSEERPGDAIRLFRQTFATCLEVLHEDKQLIARKTAKWPTKA
jgi:predicted O-methyltransferase YrrM